MSEKWTLVSPEEALDAIAQWRDLDLISSDKETVVEHFNRIFGPALPVFKSGSTLPGDSSFYRVRRLEYEIKDVRELWAKKSAVPMNRCNFIGDPMLYVSTDPVGCFDELNVGLCEQVYFITYAKKKEVPIYVRSPFGEDLYRHNMAKDVFETDEDTLSYRIFREFLISEFMKPTCSKCNGSNFLYNVTASICDYVKKALQDDGSGKSNVDGIRYPSAVNIHSGNVAFFAEAEQKLEIKNVEVLELVSRSKTGDIICHRKSVWERDGDQVSWEPQSGDRPFSRRNGR
jgi:hypothetical protein